MSSFEPRAIVPITPADCEIAAALLARAFEDDPGWQYIFPDPARRPALLGWLYPRILSVNLGAGATVAFRADDDPRMLAVASWLPPGKIPGLLDFLGAGLLRVPFHVGAVSTARILESLLHMEREKHRVMKRGATWYLDQLGVDVGMQGKGHGRRLLMEQLASGDPRSTTPCMLFTSKARNVRFYEGFGFVVSCERRFGGASGYVLWTMERR